MGRGRGRACFQVTRNSDYSPAFRDLGAFEEGGQLERVKGWSCLGVTEDPGWTPSLQKSTEAQREM